MSKHKPHRKTTVSTFKKGQEVFMTAFIKKDKNKFYVCRAVIDSIPQKNERQVYKVKIVAVGDRAIGGKPVVEQASLLGLTVTKSAKELHHDLPTFMVPPNWIEIDPNDTKKQAIVRDKNGVINRRPEHTSKKNNQPRTPRQSNHHGQTQRKGQETN